MRQWRLIYDKPASGSLNMAIDEAILTHVAAGISLPTLRFYGWSPMCLSLGYGQRASDVDETRLAQFGWDLVRRPTGGRAILHGDELTYSVIIPADHPLAEGDVVESYRRISRALMAGLEKLGVRTEAERQHKRSGELGPVCFEIPSHYEITANGRKLLGSAQVRRKDAILQHGTLPLCGDITRIVDALSYQDEHEREEARQHVFERATTVEHILGRAISWEDTASVMAQAFADTFDIQFELSELSVSEEYKVTELTETYYANASWIHKR